MLSNVLSAILTERERSREVVEQPVLVQGRRELPRQFVASLVRIPTALKAADRSSPEEVNNIEPAEVPRLSYKLFLRCWVREVTWAEALVQALELTARPR